MVDLVWSGGGLPFLTMRPFWVRAGRGRPLPIITTWTRGQGIDLSVGVMFAGLAVGPELCRVITVENRPHHQKWQSGRSGSKRKFSEPPAGIATEPMVADLVGQ